MRIGTKGLKYFKKIWNILDLISFIILLILFTIFYVGEMDKNNVKKLDDDLEKDDIIALAIIFLRYIV